MQVYQLLTYPDIVGQPARRRTQDAASVARHLGRQLEHRCTHPQHRLGTTRCQLGNASHGEQRRVQRMLRMCWLTHSLRQAEAGISECKGCAALGLHSDSQQVVAPAAETGKWQE